MAAKSNKTGTGVFGFFKKKPPVLRKKEVTKASPDQEETLDSIAQVSQMIINVFQEKLPARVFLGNSSFPYYSHFECELIEDGDGKIVNSIAHMERGEYLLMAALDPPIGNLKIRSATEINVEFFTRFYLLNCKVTLQRITGTRKLCFSFPTKLTQKPQKRSSFRAPIDRSLDINVSVTRPSGITFKVKLADISVGGTAFYPTGATPRIAEHSRVELDIDYPDGNVAVDAVILGTFAKDGEQFFRSQFLVANHKTAGDIGALVAYIQRENTQKRIKTFE